MKKLVALLTAGVLCLGMSMSVFAKEVPSGSEGDAPSANPADHTTVTANGKEVGVTFEDITDDTIVEIVNDNKKLEQLLKDAGYDVKAGQKVEGVFWADIQPKEEIKPDENGRVVLDLCIGALKNSGLANGNIVYVYHWGKDGLEILEATVIDVDGNGYVKVALKGLSPVAVIKVTSNGNVVAVDRRGNVVSEVRRAPRTGEF